MNTSKRLGFVAATALAIAALAPSCVVRGGYYAANYWDTSQCYWTWEHDGYGGYEQLYCWSPAQGSYARYTHSGSVVRRYPQWYGGPRTFVAVPPVRIVRPRGVIIRSAPPRPHGGVVVAQPVGGGATVVAAPVTR